MEKNLAYQGVSLFIRSIEQGGAMEIHKNPNCKKIRGSHVLEVCCAHCKCFIARYFVKMYNDRIIEGTIDFSQYHGAVFCPACGERIATRYIIKKRRIGSYPPRFTKKA